MAVPSQFNNRLGPLGAFGGEFDTFTGLAEETILGNAISVNYKSDQDTLLTLQQAPDGVNWYIQDQKLLVANEEHIFQHPTVLQFFRVIIQNRGLVDQTFGDLITSLVQIQTNNIGVVATIGDISPTKDGVLTYGLSGTSPLAMRVDASGSLITTSTATGASAASVTAWGKDALGASYPLPLTTGGAEIAMSITDPLPAGTNKVGAVGISGIWDTGLTFEEVQATMLKFNGGEFGYDGQATGIVTTMDALYGKATVGIHAQADGTLGGNAGQKMPLFSKYNYNGGDIIYSLHTVVDNQPAVQDISGTVTVASITEPLPQGTNTLGSVRVEGLYNDGTTISSINTSSFLFEANPTPTKGYVGSGLIGASVVTMDAFDGSATAGICALDDAYNGGGSPNMAGMSFLTSRYIPPVLTPPYTNPINSLHTWVDNHPAVQDISGTVTVASITAPLPTGTNTIGTVKLSGLFPETGAQLNPTTIPIAAGGSIGENAVALVTTMDAKGGNASAAICAIDVLGTGEVEYLSCSQIQVTDIHSINSLHTYVDNQPVVQVVAGRETPYIGFATAATNIPQVYADGIPGINVTGGWLYSSTQVGVAPYTGSRNKINWYLYNSATPDTDFSVSQLSNVYAVINQKSTLGTQAELPFFTLYTRPDSGVNNGGTFFKNRLTFGGQSFAGTMGQMLLFTGDDPVDIHPEITGVSRVRLQYNTGASSTTLQAAQGESIYLATLQTDSTAAPDGTRNFVFSEFSMIWSQAPVVIPISQSQVQVFDKALNASAATLVTDLSGITITANKLQVGGTVAVSNFPATQPVSGTFFQATQPVSGTFWQTTQPVSGTVAISNFPEGGSNVTIVSPLPTGTNAIGSVTVSNFPPGGSEVSVSNFPATQPVSGTFWQTTQPVSGTVAISNFPAGGSNVTVVSALPAGSNNIGSVNCNGFDNVNSQYTPLPIVSEYDERFATKYVSVLPKNTRKIYGQDGNYTLNTSWSTSVGEYANEGSKIIVLLKCSEVIGPGTASIAVQMSLYGSGDWYNTPYVFNLTTSSDRSQMLICDNLNVPYIRLANINTDQTGTGLIGVSFAYIMSLF
jgi:hypothetical protein